MKTISLLDYKKKNNKKQRLVNILSICCNCMYVCLFRSVCQSITIEKLKHYDQYSLFRKASASSCVWKKQRIASLRFRSIVLFCFVTMFGMAYVLFVLFCFAAILLSGSRSFHGQKNDVCCDRIWLLGVWQGALLTSVCNLTTYLWDDWFILTFCTPRLLSCGKDRQ